MSPERFLERTRRICAAVPADVELGIHLCYGDFEAKHFVEPRGAGKMVEFANALAAAIRHPLAYVHMPVPINRTDDDFFAPLSDLRLAKDTEVYLGVVHGADGKDGTNRRIAAAANYFRISGSRANAGLRAPAGPTSSPRSLSPRPDLARTGANRLISETALSRLPSGPVLLNTRSGSS